MDTAQEDSKITGGTGKMTRKKKLQVNQCNGSEEPRMRLYIERKLPFAYKYASEKTVSSANDDSFFVYRMERLLERFAGAWRKLAES